jgi:hypothetical protein
MRKKGLVVSIMVLLCLIFASNASANWYQCQVTQVISYASGEVRLYLSGDSLANGNGKVNFMATTPETRNILATALTAVSMGSDVMVECTSRPNNIIKPITALSLIAP